MMSRFRCICAYEGTDYHGWQSQPSKLAVQDIIENVLQQIIKKEIRVHGCSRTDSGVHARGQLFHIDLDWSHNTDALLKAMRTKLPPSIKINSIEKVAHDFHARFSTKGKRYQYQFYLGQPDPFIQRYAWGVYQTLDIEKMKVAAQFFVGEKNFRALAATHKQEQDENPIKHIWTCELSERQDSLLILTVEGSGFLYKMVRSIAGCLVEVGVGRLPLARLEEILLSHKRTKEIVTAPAQGLILDKIHY